MGNILKLLLIRHGSTLWNPEGRYQGRTDLPLSELGIEEVKKLKERIRTTSIDVVFTSPAKRAQESSTILFKKRSTPIIVHDGLLEINFGMWEGLTYKEVQQKFPDELLLWEMNPLMNKSTNGETMSSVEERIALLYQEILHNYQGKTVALIGHGGSFSIFFCHLFGIKPYARWQFTCLPASLSEVLIYPDQKAVLTLFNDRCHLNT